MRTVYAHADLSHKDLIKSPRVAWWDCSRKKRWSSFLTFLTKSVSSGHRCVSAGLWCGITVAGALGFWNIVVLF